MSASSPDDIRAAGWAVAAHNDYRLKGRPHTFWLFTNGDRCVKGEGLTDRDALNEVRVRLELPPPSDLEAAVIAAIAADKDSHPHLVEEAVFRGAEEYARECFRESKEGLPFNTRYLLSMIQELRIRRK